MYSETHYIQAKHFTNPKCLEMEDMASMILKVNSPKKVLISRQFNLKLDLKNWLILEAKYNQYPFKNHDRYMITQFGLSNVI